MSPFRCPSLFTILAFMEYEHGVFHPTGGCGAVLEPPQANVTNVTYVTNMERDECDGCDGFGRGVSGEPPPPKVSWTRAASELKLTSLILTMS